MELDQIKDLINTYYKAGKPETDIVELLNTLNLNGQSESIFDYLHSTYAIKENYIGKTLTDTGNAERLVKLYGDEIRYCYDRKKWLIWNGVVWEWDNGDQAMNMAKNTARNIYIEAASEADDEKRKALAKHAHSSESDSKRKAMLELSQSEIGIPIDLQHIDSNKWLFNCLNGTINLINGELQSHKQRDLLSVLINIDYNPAAKCPNWLKFLDKVTDSKPELIKYLQKAVGYSLTGDTREQCLFFLYGLGRNGKSTFISLIRSLLGEYGTKTSTDLFMTKDRNGSGPNEGLADLQGKRLVVGSEIEDGRRLAVVLIKEMTGGESIRADRKYEHAFEFQPTHKIWLCGNHKPIITDTTFSIWRRFKLIPFTVTIPEKEVDPNLNLKLVKELPGILAWAVQGCLMWQKEGLGDPNEVISATEAYRIEQDVLGEFIEDCCLLISTGTVSKNDLYKAYIKWCTDNNQQSTTVRYFRGKILERGITESRGTGGVRLWKGITLKDKPEEQKELVTESDTSDSSCQILPEKTANISREGNSLQKPVTNVTNVTNVNSEKLDFEIIWPNSPCEECGNDEWTVNPEKQVFCANGHIQ